MFDEHQAKIEYQTSILDILKGLYPDPVDWPKYPFAILNELKEKFSDLQTTVAKYRLHLTLDEQANLDKVWLNFHNASSHYPGGNIPGPFFSHYSGNGAMPEPKQLFKKNVAALIDGKFQDLEESNQFNELMKLPASARKDEMRNDIHILALEKIVKLIPFTKGSLANELSKQDKYKGITKENIETITRVTWRVEKIAKKSNPLK
jgi:hypothetical protein